MTRGPPPGDGAPPPREYLRYTFYRLRPSWRLQGTAARREQGAAFGQALEDLQEVLPVRAYSLVGTRGDCEFMLWTVTPRVEDLRDVAVRVASTDLGAHLDTPYSYLAMRARSQYLAGHEHAHQDGAGTPRPPVGSRFLFVYPFTKKREWYALPFEDRRRMMGEHFRIGHKYPRITIHTGYSFGIDDHEFVLAFEGDEPGEFLDLVQELRPSDASRYTAVETPIFTCRAVTAGELVSDLGG